LHNHPLTSLDAAVVAPSLNNLKSNFVSDYEDENICFLCVVVILLTENRVQCALEREEAVISFHCHTVKIKSRTCECRYMKEFMHCSETRNETFDE
jgi:hypothetical protein